MIRGGFDCSTYYLQHNGYDTHAFQQEAHALRLQEVGAALGAFVAELVAGQVFERVTIVVYSEFGRRVRENGSKGTDHGTAAPLFVLGGRVKGGLVGDHPSLAAADLADFNMKFAIDFRRVYATLLAEGLGVAPKAVLGEEFATLPLYR